MYCLLVFYLFYCLAMIGSWYLATCLYHEIYPQMAILNNSQNKHILLCVHMGNMYEYY